MRVVVAGLGSIGRRHARNLLRLGVRDIVALRTRQAPVAEIPDLRVVTDLESAFRQKPDLVVVCTPSTSHVSLAMVAARAGCDLFVEKPLSHSLEGVGELIREVEMRNLIAAVGFDLRFDPGLQEVRRLIESGCVGKVLSIQAQVGQYLPDWRPDQDYRQGVTARRDAGGGVIRELCHELDYVGWLLGPVTDVACMAGKVSDLEMETEDLAVMVLRFDSGAIGSVHLDCLQRAPTRSCRVIGEEGSIEWDYHAAVVRWFAARHGAWQEFNYRGFTRDDRFLAEMSHVLEAVERRAEPAADLRSAGQTLAISLAAAKAASTGTTVRVAEWVN